MCGIAGFYDPKGLFSHQNGVKCLEEMRDALVHRGPDDKGIWFDHSVGIGLSHRRLAILDLTEAGHQPMSSTSGRFKIIYNGEIYNHLELREKLLCEGLGQGWRGHSDTETLLACIEFYGIEKTLKMTRGMFAFALWDQEKRSLTLARDRFGEKPLYYGVLKGVLLFASELSSIRRHPAFDQKIDQDSLHSYLQRGYVPSPYSIYEDIFKLSPGSFVEFFQDINISEPKKYWVAKDIAREFSKAPNWDIAQLEDVLCESVRNQMISDVPLGSFLSGGIDSSLITALMQKNSIKKIKTFTIGFEDQEYDEAPFARKVAKHLGTDHNEVYFSHQDLIDSIIKMPLIYDEPFADASQLPTYLLAKTASKHVKVCLSGDGGDELFAGYNRHIFSRKTWPLVKNIPYPIRYLAGNVLTGIPQSIWDDLTSLIPSSHFQKKIVSLKQRRTKISSVLKCRGGDEVYENFIFQWKHPQEILKSKIAIAQPRIAGFTDISEMLLCDTTTYLPDDVLVKVDRASMFSSLEVRAPFLDSQVFEQAWRIPIAQKIVGGRGKIPLRIILNKYVPESLIDRPKTGFTVPLDYLLRSSLRDWAEDLIRSDILEEYFEAPVVRQLWSDHLQGKGSWGQQLWAVFTFISWCKNNAR